MVKRRFGTFLAILTAVLLSGTIVALLIPDRFRSQTSVLVMAEPSNIVDIEQVVTGVSNDQVGILSEIELIKSVEVLGRVVNSIGEDGQIAILGRDTKAHSVQNRIAQLYEKTVGTLGLALGADLGGTAAASASAPRPPALLTVPGSTPLGWGDDGPLDETTERSIDEGTLAEDAAQLIRDNLAVAQVGRSRVIEIDFTFTDPVIAADIANRFADNYIAAQVQAKFDATQKANLLLNEQLTTLRAQIGMLESEIERYRADTGLINRDAALVAGQRVEQLSQALIAAKAQRAAIQARKSEAENIQSGQSAFALENTAEVLGSDLIGTLRLQEIDLEQIVSTKQRQLADNHPDLTNMRGELAQLRRRIDGEMDKIVRSIEADESALRAEIDVLQTNLADADRDVARLNKAERELDALNMEIDANRNLLEIFLARAKETDVQEEFQQPDAQVISAAQALKEPSSPHRTVYVLLSLLAGIGCSLGTVLYLEVSDKTIHSHAAIREFTNLPIYGTLPHIKQASGDRRNAVLSQTVLNDPASSMAEALRRLYVKVGGGTMDQRANRRVPGKLVLFTSSRPSEGKTSLACSLAIAVRRFDKKVIIIDGDLRKPRVHHHFKTGRETGIVDFLERRCEVQEIISRDARCGVDLIIRGGSTNRPSELVCSNRLPALIELLRRHYDVIILDTAPILAAVETKAMMSLADELVYVLRWGTTTRDEFEGALCELPEQTAPDAPNMGLVINDIDPGTMRAMRGLSASYYAYYGYDNHRDRGRA